MSILIYVSLAILGIALLLYLKTRPSIELSRIPSIGFRDTINLITQKMSFEDYAAQHNYHHLTPIYKILLGARWMVISTTPTQAKDMFTNTHIFPKLNPSQFSKDGLVDRFFGLNVVNANGDEWKKYRKAMNPAFTKLFPTSVFRDVTHTMVTQWDALIDGGHGEIEVTDWMARLTLDVLGKALLDEDINSLKKTESHAIQWYQMGLNGAFDLKYSILKFLDVPWNPWRKPYYDAVDNWNAHSLRVIAKKRQQLKEKLERGDVEDQDKKEKDLLMLMLESWEEDGEQALSDDEIMRNLTLMYLAGQDTTSTALSCIIYYLGKYPEIQEKVRKEVLEILPTDEAITPKTKLPYLEAVINESLRFNPPVSMLPFRQTTQDVILDDKVIPAETMITLDIKSMQRNPEYWQNPNEFRPERWLEEDKEGKRRNAFWPFGGGARICLGMQFSLLEQRVVMSMLLRRYEWAIPADTIHKDGIVCHGISLPKPDPMMVDFKLRIGNS